MNETPTAVLDQAAFQRVWRRIMPQDRADCPFTLEEPPLTPAPQPLVRSPLVPMPEQSAVPQPVQAPPRPTPCLGEASLGELPVLEELIDAAALARKVCQTLARGGRQGIFSTLAAAKGRQVRRLGAAYFLISGRDYTPAPAPALSRPSGAQALRERFRAQQESASALMEAAQATMDPCLSQLYRELAQEDRELAQGIRDRLERRSPPQKSGKDFPAG